MSYWFCSKFYTLSVVQKFSESVKMWQSFEELKGGNFFETQCILLLWLFGLIADLPQYGISALIELSNIQNTYHLLAITLLGNCWLDISASCHFPHVQKSSYVLPSSNYVSDMFGHQRYMQLTGFRLNQYSISKNWSSPFSKQTHSFFN